MGADSRGRWLSLLTPAADHVACLLPVHWLLYICTIFVNKYVLSILHFTYPTIFQGWQTLVGAVFLRSMTLMGKIDMSVADINRSNVTPSIPAMFFFVGMIYAGSRALANLPIAVFMAVHSVVHILNEVGNACLTKQIDTVLTKMLSLSVIGVSAVLVVVTDPQFSGNGYFWLSLHIIFTALIKLYYSAFSSYIKLSSIDKLYCNYCCSLVVLAPSSYFLGDALAAKQFPYLYFYKFYAGCVMSGLFGVFLNICAIRLTEKTEKEFTEAESLKVSSHHSSAFAKILVSILSLLVFDMELSVFNLLCIFACLVANFINKFDGTEFPVRRDGTPSKDTGANSQNEFSVNV